MLVQFRTQGSRRSPRPLPRRSSRRSRACRPDPPPTTARKPPRRADVKVPDTPNKGPLCVCSAKNRFAPLDVPGGSGPGVTSPSSDAGGLTIGDSFEPCLRRTRWHPLQQSRRSRPGRRNDGPSLSPTIGSPASQSTSRHVPEAVVETTRARRSSPRFIAFERGARVVRQCAERVDCTQRSRCGEVHGRQSESRPNARTP